MGEHFFLIIITGVDSTIFPDNAATLYVYTQLMQQPTILLGGAAALLYSLVGRRKKIFNKH